MNIAFIIQGLTTGGAEKNLLLVANAAAKAGDSVSIITLDDGTIPASFPVAAAIRRIPIGRTTKGLSGFTKLFRLLSIPGAIKQAVKESGAELVVSFMDQANILTLVALWSSKIPCVISERINPEFSSLLEHTRSPAKRWVVRTIRDLLYRRARYLVVQTERAKNSFPAAVQAFTKVIPNPIAAPLESVPVILREKIVLGAGRLVEQKRFDLLLEAFARVHEEFPDWRLTIAGEGRMRDQLQHQAQRLGIETKLTLLGAVRELGPFYRSAGVFVLTSDFEGFPTVLGEAMAHGTAVIATDCDFGPRELITSKAEGLLIPCGNVDELARALRQLLGDPKLRGELGDAAQIVTQRFEIGGILDTWRKLLISAHSRPIA